MNDDKLTISELKIIVKKFCDDRDWDQYHNPKDLAIGIVTESSELIEHFRFKSEKEISQMFKNKTQKAKINEELADVFYFLLRFAQKYKIDLSYELVNKIKQNEKKYPISKAKGSNKKYTEL